MQLASTKNPSFSGGRRMGVGFMGALDGGRGSVLRVIACANKAAPAFAHALARTVFGLRFRVKGTKSNAIRCVGDPIDDEDVVVDEDGDSILNAMYKCINILFYFYYY
jgi:ABC-type uncharacterized transport system permease subunit